VTKAAGGKQGLDLIAERSFDCVVVDLVMPDLDGIQVCHRIHALARTEDRSMSVVMLTACETKEDMTRGLEAGADDFVGKSSDMTVLKARIRALLRRKLFQEENRRIREELMHKELEAAEARAATELVETKAALAVELERKNRELEAFSYSVSHDLRAPLRSIDGFSSALLADHRDQLDAKGQDYLCRIRAAARRMGELIDDLLQLSRVGRADLQRMEIDLSAMAHLVATGLRQSAPERKVKIAIESGIVTNADQRLLQVVLENLLGNAWKFTARISEARIEVGTSTQDGVISYFVRDNGAGFDMAYADKLFAPFQRLHSDTKFPGTGIGLATVQRIVERHGGRIWGEGTVDRGATFSWTFPNPQTGRMA
jgi:light-regulated signal transduction histidine kinase (bacteriophytochrome)